MKKKVTKKNFSELDKFDRKQKRHGAPESKNSKNKYSIYEDFDEEDLDEEDLDDDYEIDDDDEEEDFEDR